MKKSLLADLFFTFMKIGLFTFGGGYAMVALIADSCVEKKKWLSQDEMLNITVVAESTPGPIAINCATYVGYRQAGLIGSIVATLGMVLPSFVVILLIANLLDDFLAITWIANAFKGIKVAVGLLIVSAAVKMIRKMPKTRLSVNLLIVSAAVMLLINVFALNFSSIALMLLAGAFSLVLFVIHDMKQEKGSGERP